ncbi:ExeM/NucH family extracellular endonuclease [Nocardioides sp. 616]|uniref:ExeM/NucH family extracellular endonuclease n=1 Tax=Nocardioides sp. 616 TaxID=2268090 RepID=UPI000CE3E2A7|nr:ExeM/NucH family extracellular endonuclease [Nocardioides sp. 616]
MGTAPPRRHHAFPAGLGLLVAATALVPLSATANPAGTGLVISEVYGAGGNSGAVRNQDFVELFNPTSAAISVAGMSVQYRSAGNGGTGVTALTGSVPAGGHYLVGQAGGTEGTALPAVDASGQLNLSGSNGIAFLAEGTTPVILRPGSSVAQERVVDLVGFGTTPSVFETAPTGVALTSTTSAARPAGDTDDNAADFTIGAPTPTNAAGQTQAPTGPGPVDPAAPTARSIAEIQGPGDTSPLVGTRASTRGVVTAVLGDPYPAELGTYGGFDGFYLQTSGTGGGTDATPSASDAVFVYAGASPLAGVEVGDSVQVTGEVAEFFGLTQVVADGAGVVELAAPLAPVTALETAYPTTDAGREAHEGELLTLTDELTVTNSFATNQYGEIGLATGGTPLVQPTEVVRDDDVAGLARVKADNAARAVTLDDGTGINYLTNDSPQQDLPLPWLSATHSVRVGARATLIAPVILDFRNNTWKLQPRRPVTDQGTDTATFQDTRATNAAPAPVGGDLRLATFNVLNYFNTTGEQYVAAGAAQSPPVQTACTWFEDRDGNRIGNRSCGVGTGSGNDGSGPRGAATAASFGRQQAKLVRAINTLDADVVALEEVENSIKLVGEADRDDALASLVTALNADAGSRRWRFVPSPQEAVVPAAVSQQDVIRSAFIYQHRAVRPVGRSDLLLDTTEFANAREPLAQAFRPRGAGRPEAFAVIANHFKSKGDSTPPATGDNAQSPDTGAFNGDRVRQATRLGEFATQFAAARRAKAVFLVGDFNSYSQEDPMHVLYDRGYAPVESQGEETYSYGGLSGSLDHVLGNPAAMAMVTGADIWSINSSESPAYQYSRFNYNVRQLFSAADPFATSDHDPELVGLATRRTVPASVRARVAPRVVQVGRGRARLTAVVRSSRGAPTGIVRAILGGRTVGRAELTRGRAVLSVGPFCRPGVRRIVVEYLGDATTRPGRTTVSVRVKGRR